MGSVGRRLRRSTLVQVVEAIRKPVDLPQSEALLALLRGLPLPAGAPSLFSVTGGGVETEGAAGFIRTLLSGVDAERREPSALERLWDDETGGAARSINRTEAVLIPTDDSYEVNLRRMRDAREGLEMQNEAARFAEREALAWLREPSADAYERVETRTLEGGMYRADELGRLTKVEEEEP